MGAICSERPLGTCGPRTSKIYILLNDKLLQNIVVRGPLKKVGTANKQNSYSIGLQRLIKNRCSRSARQNPAKIVGRLLFGEGECINDGIQAPDGNYGDQEGPPVRKHGSRLSEDFGIELQLAAGK